jgi:hypothetical protein
MLTTEQINDLHRLYWSEHWPIRKIERHLNMGWKTIRKYLDAPAQSPVHRDRPSKLDPFKGAVAEWLEKDPGVSAAVIEQKLRAAGYQGGHSILREYVRNMRPHLAPKRAFVRMEPLAGERFEVDWGHFGALSYSGDMRKLYAFALVEAHSRMLYVEFTHSQNFETFARCHIHAFTALGGVAREIACDNLGIRDRASEKVEIFRQDALGSECPAGDPPFFAGAELRSACDVSSRSCTVVFQPRESQMKAQGDTLADLHFSAQTRRSNDEEAIGASGHRNMRMILRNGAASNGSSLRRCALRDGHFSNRHFRGTHVGLRHLCDLIAAGFRSRRVLAHVEVVLQFRC